MALPKVLVESSFLYAVFRKDDPDHTVVRRARDLLRQYPGTKLELVDCCIVAMAERLNITQVATLDRRDFSIIRTGQGTFLEILP